MGSVRSPAQLDAVGEPRRALDAHEGRSGRPHAKLLAPGGELSLLDRAPARFVHPRGPPRAAAPAAGPPPDARQQNEGAAGGRPAPPPPLPGPRKVESIFFSLGPPPSPPPRRYRPWRSACTTSP